MLPMTRILEILQSGRITCKNLSGEQLIAMIPFNSAGVPDSDLLEFLRNELPIPPVIVKMDRLGNYEVLGKYSYDVLSTLHVVIDEFTKRRYRNVYINVIIFEPCGYQDELIELYIQKGFIK